MKPIGTIEPSCRGYWLKLVERYVHNGVTCEIWDQLPEGERLVDWTSAELEQQDMSGKNFRYFDLTGADFFNVDLVETDLTGSKLEHVDLRWSDMTGVIMPGGSLKRSNLEGVHLEGANLHKVDMRYAKLRGAHLAGANLSGANLRGADLRGADLTGVDLTGANLSGVDLREVDLREAKLDGITFSGTKFEGAKRHPHQYVPQGWNVKNGCMTKGKLSKQYEKRRERIMVDTRARAEDDFSDLMKELEAKILPQT